MSDRPKVGAAFAAPAPDRVSGLGDLLSRGEATAAPTPVPAAAAPPEAPADTVEAVRPGPAQRARPAARQTKAAAGSGTRIVSVLIDVAARERLRDVAARSGRTHGAVALDAIEAHADELVAFWGTETGSGARKLFPAAPRAHRRTQAGTPTQLRMTPAAADVLDDLVARWGAPSRSALVNEALRRYLTQQETP